MVLYYCGGLMLLQYHRAANGFAVLPSLRARNIVCPQGPSPPAPPDPGSLRGTQTESRPDDTPTSGHCFDNRKPRTQVE